MLHGCDAVVLLYRDVSFHANHTAHVQVDCPKTLVAMPGDECGCAPGIQPGQDAGTCVNCAVGTFKPDAGQVKCQACPADTWSYEPGAVAKAACVCVPGLYHANDKTGGCRPCAGLLDEEVLLGCHAPAREAHQDRQGRSDPGTVPR